MEINIKEIKTALSAFDLYRLFTHKDNIFLDSAKDPDRLGRYSYIGMNPFKKIVYQKGIVTENGSIIEGEPFQVLNRLLARYRVDNDSGLPFVGGCIGYLSYDLAWDLEKLPVINEPGIEIPDLYFVFYNNIIVVDHHKKKTYITELRRSVMDESKTEAIERRIQQGETYEPGAYKDNAVDFVSPFTKESYMEAVEAMRRYIRSGDIYIANMTHKFTGHVSGDSLSMYGILRHMNPAPFGAYLPLDGFEVLCSSPERFLRIDRGKVETRPIKGTRPRGGTSEEDEANIRALEDSEKDKSELLMVVDLERNDLSKVCRPYTVKVTELFEIESYATVHHLVATVVGKLRDDKTAVDCLKACFPGGSITGTPKIRAMEVIEELEKDRRNIYTGCIGYFGFDGGADFNIVIRTMLRQGDYMEIGVGGGITWESEAAAEYQETLDKAAALFKAAGTVEVKDETGH